MSDESVLARSPQTVIAARVTSALSSRWAPVVCGAITALVTWCVWGSLDQVPVIHDEAAYLLQAKLFATGRWSAAGWPLPEFFEQYHVLVTPRLVPKYPPGHALLLAPGMWLGLPGLVPVLLSGVTGALIFALARRLAHPWVGLLTWFISLAAPADLSWRPSYFSETTTGVLWLAAWWALLQWRDTRRQGWLVTLAACVAWGLITRPLTMLMFALPVAAIVLRWTWARRTWGSLGLAVALGAAILAIVPLWNARTTGDWRTMPYALYSRVYFPFDVPGFGLDTTPPQRSLPPDMERWAAEYRETHRAHTVGALPSILGRRLLAVAHNQWRGGRMLLVPFALLGALALPAAGLFALGTGGLVVLGYLVFGYDAAWTVYYLELQPVLAFAAALGLWRTLGRLPRGAAVSALWLTVCAAPLCTMDIVRRRAGKRARQEYQHRFLEHVERIPEARAVVFVRYGPRHNVHGSLIRNEPDLERARVWIVYDRGPENVRLMRLAPDRTPYLYDEVAGKLVPLPRSSSP